MIIPRLFQTTSRIVMGAGSLNKLSEEVKRLGGKKVMIITDPGIVNAGMINGIESMLTSSSLEWKLFDSVEPDPKYELAIEAAKAVKDAGADSIIGIGGGSSLDIAKIASILVTNTDPIGAYFGIDLVPKAGLPMILIPTTAGTGSEVTPIAILSDHHEKLKKGIVSPYLFPNCAILDCELTLGLPDHVTAATGMDALIHAIESYTSKNASNITDMLAIEAMTLIFENIRTAYSDGSNLEARAKMLEGSMLAGMAFANAGVTAVHAFAYPIGAEFHIPHGLANSIMLAPVMEFNMLGNLSKFASMAQIFGESVEELSDRDAAETTIEVISILSEDLKMTARLSDFGVKEDDVPGLAAGVLKVTRLLANNPRLLKQEDAEEIYRQVL